MNFKFLSIFSRRSPVESRERTRGDGGAAAIIMLMMSLVFVPIVLAHAATLYKGNLKDIGPQQIAAIVQMIAQPITGTN